MSRPIQPTGRFGGMKAIRGKRAAEQAERTEAAQAAAAPEPAAAVQPTAAPHGVDEAPPVISAQIFGQSDTAETAGSANIAGKARAAYLGVEWSGPADRRTGRGRITKTDI